MMARVTLAACLLQLVTRVDASVASGLPRFVDRSPIPIQRPGSGQRQGGQTRPVTRIDPQVQIETEWKDRTNEGVALGCD